MTTDERLDKMIQVAKETGVSLDEVVKAMRYLRQTDFDAVSESPSRLPRYMKSSVTP